MTGEVPDVLREQLDVPQGGLVVESVLPDTLAARLGIRRNDVLLRVAGQDVASAPDVRKALGAVAAGADLQVEVIRKGRRETLTAKR
jgi:S1-C subfamily serine protease